MATLPQGYLSRIAPQAGASLPRTSAEDFGAGLADAARGFARTVHSEGVQDEQIEQRLERNRQWSQFQVDYAALRQDMADQSREARLNYNPEHAKALEAAYKERETALLESIGDRQVRERARGSLATWGSAFVTGERDWQTVRGSEIAVDAFRDARDASANRVRRLESPDDYAAELLVQRDAIDGMDASDKVKDQLWEETEQTLAISYLQGRIDEDARLAKAMLDEGAFDEILTPQQVEQLLNGSAVEIRRMDAAAERQVSQAKALLREDLRLFNKETGNGLDRSDQIPSLRARAEALQMADVVEQLDSAAADIAFARAYQDATPVQLEQRMAVLRRKGDARTDLEARELKYIGKTLPGRWERYNSDPVGHYARTGEATAPPPLDFDDPLSIVARGQWATATSAVDGRPVPVLSKIEAAQLRQIYDEGRQGEEQVLAMLNRLMPAQAMQAAKMIDPGNKTLPIVATLPAHARSAARAGREVLKANRKFLSEPLRDDLDLEEAITELNERFTQAMVSVPPDQRDAVMETAKQIAAGYLDRNGEQINETVWHLSLNLAMGSVGSGDRQQGGFASWGDRWYLLPSGVTDKQFRSEARQQLQASSNPPVNPDGSAVDLSRAYPVAVGPGLYEFRSGSGAPMRSADGSVWRIQVGR